MKWILYACIGYMMLYSVVWLHEIGHSVFYAHYGCKKNWLHVTVKPYIFFSTPAPLETDQLYKITKKQNTIISYGGVLSNAFWSMVSIAVLCFIQIENAYLLFPIWLFLTLHLVEIVSYLFVGNIYLVSDMANIAQCYPKLRLPNLMLGCILTVVYLFVLSIVPSEICLACSRLECGDLSLYVRRENCFFSHPCQKAQGRINFFPERFQSSF